VDAHDRSELDNWTDDSESGEGMKGTAVFAGVSMYLMAFIGMTTMSVIAFGSNMERIQGAGGFALGGFAMAWSVLIGLMTAKAVKA